MTGDEGTEQDRVCTGEPQNAGACASGVLPVCAPECTRENGRTAAVTGQTVKPRARVRQASAARPDPFEDALPGPDEQAALTASLGALLLSLRTERGLSTRTLAARSTLARSTVTRLETGQRRPRPVTLKALAFGLDHLDPGPLLDALTEAAGPSLRPDTPGGRRRHARRHEAALKVARERRGLLARQVQQTMRQADALLLSAMNRVPTAPVRTTRDLRRERDLLGSITTDMDRAERLKQGVHRALSHMSPGAHPLDLDGVEQALQSLTEARQRA